MRRAMLAVMGMVGMAAVGCHTYTGNRRLMDEAVYEKIHEGATKAEIRELLGDPDYVGAHVMPEGPVEAWTYMYANHYVPVEQAFIPFVGAAVMTSNSKTTTRTLSLTFDEEGKLMSWSRGKSDTKYMQPGTGMGPEEPVEGDGQ